MATATAGPELSSYDELLIRYRPRPISREAQYRRALKQIDGLMARDRLSPSEEDLLQLLAALVMQYEQARFPVPDVPPSRVLAHLLEARGMTRAEVARATGIPRQTITNIINGSRGISAGNRQKLADYFRVAADLFRPAEG